MSADGVAALLTDDREHRLARVEQLVEVHCAGPYAGGVRRDDAAGVTTYAGWGGFPFGDDGYDFMGRLPANWKPMPDVGDWPYLIYWIDRRQRSVVEYCEGDLSVNVADTDDALRRLVQAILAEHPA